MKWFKFYGQDWLTDLKIRKMRIEDRLCFITLLCLASSSDSNGVIRNCDESSLIEMTGLHNDPLDDDNEYARAVGCLERYKALQIVTLADNGDVTLVNFNRRQGENLSNAERQKNYRERLKTTTKPRNDRNVTQRNDSNARIEENRKEKKNTYGEFNNVFLSEEEHRKLVESLNESAVSVLIAELSGYLASTGKKYKSHYATLQNWARRRINDHVQSQIKSKAKVAFS